MEIFLVRHGQTGGNIAHRHQAEHTPLSFKGEEQARNVADVIKGYEPTHLLTSNLVRTLETSDLIGKATGLIPETNSVFIELVRPDNLYGYRHRSFKSVWYYFQWFIGVDIGGESYNDFLKRIELAKDFISQYPQDSKVVVVSHTVFINLFLAHLCRKKKLSLISAVLVFIKIITMPNTHVIKINYNSKTHGACPWSVEQKT